jgi:hypothetical protein
MGYSTSSTRGYWNSVSESSSYRPGTGHSNWDVSRTTWNAAEEVHKNAAKPVATTYQSNNSLLKSNTDGDGSHDSSSRKHPSTEAEEDREFLIKSIVASLVVMIVFIILIISCFCKNNEDCCSSCDFTPGGATKPEDLINGSKPHNKRYLRKAPSMLRSSSYTV